MRTSGGSSDVCSSGVESRTSGQGFAIVHWPAANKENTAGKEKSELRYAYFAYFQPWDWVFAVSGDAREVVKQFDARRKEMEHSISEALTSMRLAQSGFVFIAADSGRMISPLPAAHTGLLGDRKRVV